jgi:hypothetical protein
VERRNHHDRDDPWPGRGRTWAALLGSRLIAIAAVVTAMASSNEMLNGDIYQIFLHLPDLDAKFLHVIEPGSPGRAVGAVDILDEVFRHPLDESLLIAHRGRCV